METEKSHDLPSANWRPKNPGLWFWLSPKAWEPGTPITGKKDVSAQVIKQDGASSFVFYLGSIQALNGLSDAHPHWGGHQFKCKSHPETPSQTYLEIMFNLRTPGQASWHTKLSGIAVDPQTRNLPIMVMIPGCLSILTLSFLCGPLPSPGPALLC